MTLNTYAESQADYLHNRYMNVFWVLGGPGAEAQFSHLLGAT